MRVPEWLTLHSESTIGRGHAKADGARANSVSEHAGVTNAFRLKDRYADIAVGGLIALKVAILFLLAWNTRFVMDEFVQFGWSKYLGNGLFETVWPDKSAAPSVFFEIAHLIGWDATSILLAGRLETALLACATLAIVYACARSLGQCRVHGLVIVLVLLSFSNFMERIFRTISEPLAVFFATAALLAILRGRADSRRSLIIAGVLSGLSFLATQKSVYFNFALGFALVADAALARRYGDGIFRGVWLVVGWALPIVTYCFVFGGSHPGPIAERLFFGPLWVLSPQVAAEYGGLRHFVLQTLERNAFLYAICFAGMALGLIRIHKLDQRRRIALIFTTVIAVLVFAHDQPWPYVFIMALPFMALWVLEPFDPTAVNRSYLRIGWIVLILAVAASFARNLLYLQHDNRDQMELIGRAESLLAPGDRYFDGIGMLPNRFEPSTLWLARHSVLETLREGKDSEAYKILSETPPKLIIWSYRMDAIEPVVAPLIHDSYVKVAPNIRLAGRRLRAGEPTRFDVPIPGRYRLYNEVGQPIEGKLVVGGNLVDAPVNLTRGAKLVSLQGVEAGALLLPEGSYAGQFRPGSDNKDLFAGVYD